MKKIVVLAAGTALAASAAISQPASAAGESVTVPKAGPATAWISWSGTVPIGTNMDTFFTGGAGCAKAQAPFRSEHDFTVKVAPGAYHVIKATMAVAVTPGGTFGSATDYMDLVDPTGTSVGTDSIKSQLEVDVPNPVAGVWKLYTCEFLPFDTGLTHPYDATVTIKTKCLAASPCPTTPKKKHR